MAAEGSTEGYWDIRTEQTVDFYPDGTTSTRSLKHFNSSSTTVIWANDSCLPTCNVSDDDFFNVRSGVTIEVSNTTSETSSDIIPVVIVCLVSCISIATVFGNIAIIVCVARNRSLLTVYNIYAASLAFADLLVGVVVMTCMSVYTFFGLWPLGADFCTIWVLFDFTCCTISMLHLDAIAFDRYKSVTSPLLYRTTFTKSRAVKISLLMWLIGSILWVPPIFYFRVTDKQNGRIVEDDCYFIPEKYFLVGQVIAAYYIPVIFMVVVYMLLFFTLNNRQSDTKKIEKNQLESETTVWTVTGRNKKDKSCTSAESNVDDVKLSELSGIPEAAKKILMGVNSVNKKAKYVSAKRQESAKISSQNRRCIRTLGAIIVVFLVCWLPFVVFWPVAAFCETCIPVDLYAASYWMAYINSFVNPYIYFLLNRDFRNAFKKTFLGRRRSEMSHWYSTGASHLSDYDD